MLGGEGVAVVGGWEPFLLAWIEDHLQRGHVGLNEDVRGNHLRSKVNARAVFGLVGCKRRRLQVGARAVCAWLRQTRVLMPAHVVPGPSVEATFLDGSDIVG